MLLHKQSTSSWQLQKEVHSLRAQLAAAQQAAAEQAAAAAEQAAATAAAAASELGGQHDAREWDQLLATVAALRSANEALQVRHQRERQ